MTRLSIFIFFILTLNGLPLLAQGGLERIEKSWNDAQKELEDSRFEAEKRIHEKFSRLEARLNKLWDKVDKSTVKEYVDYGEDCKSKTKVEFEKGFVAVEVIEDKARENLMKDDILKKINEQIITVAGSKDGDGVQFLKNQFDKKALIQAVDNPVRSTYKAPDGTEKVKYTVQMPLKQGHLHERALQYVPLAKQMGALFGVPVDLILAVMECESTFNPYADNGIAFGLMQLVPKAGAYDAALTAFGQKQLIPPHKLKNPEINARLGVAYFHQFLNWPAYLKEYENTPSKAQIMAIAGYNCGMGRILSWIKKNPGMLRESDEVFIKALRAVVPDETKHYLVNVPAKRRNYQGL